MSLLHRGILAVVIGVILGAGLSFGPRVHAKPDKAEANSTLPWEEARLLAEVFERVKRDYVDHIDDAELVEAAVRGVLTSLDPHSNFLTESEYREMRITTSGNYAGVGVEVSLRDGMVVVVSPIDATPAQRAGMEAGDVIVMVDEEPVDPEDLDATIERMRGEVGTQVRLSVSREQTDDILHFDLERTQIAVHSVRHEMLEPGVGYVRISQFSETTGTEVTDALLALQDNNGGSLTGLVLDLRNNPGGLLDAAVAVSDAFLEEGQIVSADGRLDGADFDYAAHAGDLTNNANIVVLVNAGTASASEIVAGALQDHGRATIMGDVTYGKGSVQTIVPLSKGRAMKLTTSRYFTPSGRSIHGFGIRPDRSLTGTRPADFAAATADAPLVERDYSVARAVDELHSAPSRHTSAAR
ncbi:MAG: S41 family peptidase [Gammaproteobacteria bacterium]